MWLAEVRSEWGHIMYFVHGSTSTSSWGFVWLIFRWEVCLIRMERVSLLLHLQNFKKKKFIKNHIFCPLVTRFEPKTQVECCLARVPVTAVEKAANSSTTAIDSQPLQTEFVESPTGVHHVGK